MVQKLKIVLAIISLLFLARAASYQPPTPISAKPAAIAVEKPLRLIIPAIGVDAKIQSVGVNTKGEMEVPSNIVDVGWFELGTRPGEVGSAVIAGHLNGENGEDGVFANLDKLKQGDLIYIKSLTFRVFKTQTYDSGYADEVFSKNDGIYLNLVTCKGLWNRLKKDYNKRLVVSTNLGSEPTHGIHSRDQF